ncbi:MAG TPA: TolC family protein [Oxalobacteraceae bacterium]|nr:TolC family protein [Oxalobacteraceae bacterium]
MGISLRTTRKISISALITALAILGATPGTRAAGYQMADPFGTAALMTSSSERQDRRPCSILSSTGVLSLTDVVDISLCNNPQTRQAWANVLAQAAQVGVAQSAYLPSLNATASASHNWTDTDNGSLAAGRAAPSNERSADAVLSYLLYDFGARGAAVRNARQLLVAAAATQDNTVQAVILAAVQAFYQVQATLAALDAAMQSERSSLEGFKAADARYKAGVATPADSLQAQTAYSQAVLNRVQAEGALKNAQGTLANAMGLDADKPLTLAVVPELEPPKAFERDVVALVEEARQRRPDLAAAQAQLDAAQANIDAARAAGKPAVSLSASTGYLNQSGFPSSHATTLGISVSVPLFSGFASTYRIRAAEAQAEATGAQFDRVRLQVALDVWQAYQNLHTAMQSVRTTAYLLASAEQSQRVALGRYKAGAGTVVELLAAESALASARQQRVQSLFNWNVSRVTLGQAMGTLDYGLLETMPGAADANSTEGTPPP